MWGQFHKEIPQLAITKISLKITSLNFQQKKDFSQVSKGFENSLLSYCVDKLIWIERKTDADNDNTPPALGLRGKNYQVCLCLALASACIEFSWNKVRVKWLLIIHGYFYTYFIEFWRIRRCCQLLIQEFTYLQVDCNKVVLFPSYLDFC